MTSLLDILVLNIRIGQIHENRVSEFHHHVLFKSIFIVDI